MITVKNDYEPIIYEQPFSSHIYENQLELLHTFYTSPTNSNTRTTQEVSEINTVIKPDKKTKENAQTQSIFVKTYKKNNREKKFGQSHFS